MKYALCTNRFIQLILINTCTPSTQAIYLNTDGPNWFNDDHWDFSVSNPDPCSPLWYGLNCTADGEAIIEIRLDENNLRGSLSNEMFNSFNESLERFSFGGNSLNGTLPAAIYNLSALSHVNVSFNSLSGTISPAISNLQQLRNLSMFHNQFTGTLTSRIGDLQNIEALAMYNNSLNGTIPDSIGDLTALKFLSLRDNLFSGTIPFSLGNCLGLTSLYLYGLGVTGGVPSSLGNLSKLENLALNNNKLSGQLPDTFSNLQNLVYLLLNGNQLDGPLTKLWSLTKLEILYSYSNRFTGSISGSVGDLRNIKTLYLKGNLLTGTLPSEIEKLSKLQTFDVSHNSLHGSINDNLLTNAQSLQKFVVSSNRFTGPVPIVSSQHLKTFDISLNKFTGFIPSLYFENNSQIEIFSASLNCLSRAIPSAVCKAEKLTQLVLCSVGSKCPEPYPLVTVPSCLWSIGSLERLYLTGNSYHGFLDSYLSPNVSHLNIAFNNFRGSVPIQKGVVYEMDTFDVSNNLFYGTMYEMNVLPYGGSTNYTIFRADINRLSGGMSQKQLEEFQLVAALEGNIIQCDNLPSNDISIGTYVCETENYEYAFVLWLVVFGLCIILLVILIANKRASTFKQFRQVLRKFYKECTKIQRNDMNEVNAEFEGFIQMLATLKKLARYVLLATSVLFVMSIVVYSSLKLNDHNDLYRTHEYQYWYTVSGVYIKYAVSGVCVYILFFSAVFLNTIIFFRCFDEDWRSINLRNLHFNKSSYLEMRRKHHIKWEKKVWKMIGLRICVISLFISTSLLVNIGYVFLNKMLDAAMDFLLQVGVIAFNMTLRLLIPYIAKYLYPNEGKDRYTLHVVETMAGLLSFANLAVPFMAAGLASELCFANLIFPVKYIPVDTTYTECILPYTINSIPIPGECAEYSQFGDNMNIEPPFVYSAQVVNILVILLFYIMYLSSLFASYNVSPSL